MRLTAQMVVPASTAARLARIADDCNKFKSLRTIAGRIQTEAKARVPVKSGELRDSIGIRYHQKYSGKMVAIIGSKLEYAHRIERGFIKADSRGHYYDQPAQPFLRPARRIHNAKVMKELYRSELRGPLGQL